MTALIKLTEKTLQSSIDEWGYLLPQGVPQLLRFNIDRPLVHNQTFK